MAYISKFKGSEIDSILTDVRNSIKPDLQTVKNNLSKSVTDINTEIEEINSSVSSISGEISNIKKDLTQANTAINSVTEKAKEIDNKQNTISDLETIREGAAKGATAIQEVKTINGESIVGKGDIIIKGGNGSGPNVVTLNGDEVCDYYAINKSGEHVLASGYGCTSYIDCYGCGTMDITLMQEKSNTNYGLAFYDADKKFISFVASKVGSEKKGVITTVAIPENAHYFRATYFNFENQKNYGDFSCTLTYDTSIVSADGKRKYQDGFIYFSQRVNQSVTPYWSTDEVVTNTGEMKVTTGVLALPTTYKNTGRKTPLILYAHGLSHYVYYGKWGATETFPVQKQHWLDMGFAVMDCNGARDNNRAGQFASGICPQGINAYKLCVEYIQQHYNVSDDIFIVAGSAGGAVGWNYLSMYGSTVKAAVFIAAWTDMKANAWTSGGQSKLYKEYLGFNDTSTYEVDKTIGFDPTLKIVTIDNKKYCFDYHDTPLYALYGSEDPGAFIGHIKTMFTALRNAGATAQIRMINGVGHEIVSGANMVVDTEIGNWLLSHYQALNNGADITYHTVAYKYVDENGSEIKTSIVSNVMDGITIDFAANKPSIAGYEFVSVNPTSATVTSNITVIYNYKKEEEPVTPEEPDTPVEPDVPVTPDEPEIEGNDLSSLFKFDRKNWMCVSNPLFKSSSYFDSCYTDLSAYAGKTIRITVPQYTNSAGGASTGVTFWTATPTEQPTAYNKNNLIKLWDVHDAGNAKGILVEVETVVPADTPYIWTSTYNETATNTGVYIGENDGYTDFKCYIVEQDPNDLLRGATWTTGKGFVANPDHMNNLGYTIATSTVFKYAAIDVSNLNGKTIQYSQADYTASTGGISGYGIGFVSTNNKTLTDYKGYVISVETFPYSLSVGQGTAADATIVVPEGAKLMLFTWYADNSTKYDGWANGYAKVID